MFPKDILSEVHKTDVSCPACGTNVGHTTFAPRFPCRTSDLEGAHMRRSTKPTFPKRFENPCRERLSVQTRHNLSYRTTCGPTECSVYTRARRKKMQLAIPVFPCPAVYFTSKKLKGLQNPLSSVRFEKNGCVHIEFLRFRCAAGFFMSTITKSPRNPHSSPYRPENRPEQPPSERSGRFQTNGNAFRDPHNKLRRSLLRTMKPQRSTKPTFPTRPFRALPRLRRDCAATVLERRNIESPQNPLSHPDPPFRGKIAISICLIVTARLSISIDLTRTGPQNPHSARNEPPHKCLVPQCICNFAFIVRGAKNSPKRWFRRPGKG